MAPSSGPPSGIVAPSLFRGEAGPGYWVRDDAGVEATLIDEGISVLLTRLSPTGAWFVPDPGQRYPFETTVKLRLQAGGDRIGPLFGRVVPPPTQRPDSICGITFTDIPYGPARNILLLLRRLASAGKAWLAHRAPRATEIITDSARIRSVLRAVTAVNNRGYVDGEHPVRLEALTRQGTLLWSSPTPWGEGPHVVDMAGYNSICRMRFLEARTAADRLETPLPTSIERIRYREQRRSEPAGKLTVAFHHPLWTRLPLVQRPVRDVSFGGMSFATSLDTDMLFPGLVLPAIDVHGEDGELARLRGEVRSISTAGTEEIAGISLLPSTAEDEARWNEIVARTLYSHTRTSEDAADPLWHLFVESGYFSLAGKSEEYFADARRHFEDMAQRGARAPQLFCQAVWTSRRGIEATGSSLKAYSHSWLAHQLAKRPGRPPGEVKDPGQIVRDIYIRTLEHAQKDPDLRWLICYVEPSVPWIRKSHIDFAARHLSAGRAFMSNPRMMTAVTSEMSGMPEGDVETDDASPSELAILASVLEHTRHESFLDAFDLVPERIGFTSISAQWKAAGFERERGVLVARRRGEPIAAAILETGQDGTNLFRLLDSARIVPFHPEGEGVAPHVRLLDAARRWFAARHKSSFLYLREDANHSYVKPARLHDDSLPCLWCISASLLPSFWSTFTSSPLPAALADDRPPDRKGMLMSSTLVIDLYEPLLAKARARIESDPIVAALLDAREDPRLVELFLIHYCSLGVRMTRPVEGWIRRAGERCVALGHEDVGRSLIAHAHHEAGHHELMIDDTRTLVARYCARYAAALSAEQMLAQPPTPPVLAYIELHEDTIAGDAPFAQVAIEYEVERLSVALGPRFLARVRQVLGDDTERALTFLTEHVALDVGHTQLNEKMLGRLLEARPELAEQIAPVGAQALEIYLDFMGSCVTMARDMLEEGPGARS